MAKSLRLLYWLFKWSVTPTDREVRASKWVYENYIDWNEPAPNVNKIDPDRSRGTNRW